jgi:hypothetical protein
MAKTFTLQRSVFMADAGAGLAFGHRFEAGTEVTVEAQTDTYWNAYAMHEGRKYLVHLNPLELAQAFEHVSRETAAK